MLACAACVFRNTAVIPVIESGARPEVQFRETAAGLRRRLDGSFDAVQCFVRDAGKSCGGLFHEFRKNCRHLCRERCDPFRAFSPPVAQQFSNVDRGSAQLLEHLRICVLLRDRYSDKQLSEIAESQVVWRQLTWIIC